MSQYAADEESDVALEYKDESNPTLTPSNKEERDPMEVLEKMKQLKKLKMQKKIDSLQNRPASSQEVTCPSDLPNLYPPFSRHGLFSLFRSEMEIFLRNAFSVSNTSRC